MKINFDQFDDSYDQGQSIKTLIDSTTFAPTPFEQTHIQSFHDTNILLIDHDEMDESISAFVKQQMQRENSISEDEIQKPYSHLPWKKIKEQKNQKQENEWPKKYQEENKKWDTMLDPKIESKKLILEYELNRKLYGEQPKRTKQQNKKGKKSMNWVYSYKKHKCNQFQLPTSSLRQLQQLKDSTFHPFLQTTKFNSKNTITKCLSKKYSVYDRLYREKDKRKMKKQMQLIEQQNEERERKPEINKNYFSNKNLQYKPLNQRINNILYNKVRNAEMKQNLDETSNRKMFQPNLSNSKQSYRWFMQSLSKQKLRTSKKYSLNQESDAQEYLSSKNKNKDSLLEKYKNVIDQKTIKFLIDEFYEEKHDEEDNIKFIKQEFDVLQPFLHEIQTLQNKKTEVETIIGKNVKSMASTSKGNSRVTNSHTGGNIRTIQKDEFSSIFKQFYEKLTLYDRQILRNALKRSLKKQEDSNCKQKLSHTYRPVINIRSSSLDSISKRYEDQLYYI